jgi:hypothetical protein
VLGQVLGIVYRCIATHLTRKAGLSGRTAQTGAVTLVQRFGSALNLTGTARRTSCCSGHPALPGAAAARLVRFTRLTAMTSRRGF